MRKNLLTSCIVLLTVSAFAQTTTTENKFHLGLKAAPALVWLKPDTKDLKSDGSSIGFIYGLVTEFNFAKNYAFATGIEVAYRGGKTKYFTSVVTPGLTTNTSIKSVYKLEYIEIPLTLKFKTNEIGMMTYYLQGGVSPGFNIRSRSDNDYDFQFQSTGTTKDSTASVNDVDIKDNINAFNLSMVIGGGLEYSLSGNTSLLVGISFSNGLLDVFEGSAATAKSNYLALNLGILF
jgi:hypothetical protein